METENIIDFDERLESNNMNENEYITIDFSKIFETFVNSIINPIKKVGEAINSIIKKVTETLTETAIFIQESIKPFSQMLIDVKNTVENEVNNYTDTYTERQRDFIKKTFKIIDEETGVLKVEGYEKICSIVGEDKITETIKYSTCTSIAKYFNITEKAVRTMIKRINERGLIFDIEKDDKNIKYYYLRYDMSFLILLDGLGVI